MYTELVLAKHKQVQVMEVKSTVQKLCQFTLVHAVESLFKVVCACLPRQVAPLSYICSLCEHGYILSLNKEKTITQQFRT